MTIFHRPEVEALVQGIVDITRQVAGAVLGDGAAHIKDIGILLDKHNYGVYFPHPYKTTAGETIAKIFLNFFESLARAKNAADAAAHTLETIYHEVNHHKIRGHGDDFKLAYAETVTQFGTEAHLAALKQLTELYGHLEGTIRPAITRALSIYQQSRLRRATAPDALSRAGGYEPRPTDDTGGPPADDRGVPGDRAGVARHVTYDELEQLAKARGTTVEAQYNRAIAKGYTVGNPSAGGGTASTGLFNTAPATAPIPGVAQPVPMEFPELVELMRNLKPHQVAKVIRKFRNAGTRGDFNPATRGPRSGQIRLSAELFKPGNEAQLAQTLSHEIGHFVDWLPHRLLERGNLLGRLYSLRNFLTGTFVNAAGDQILNKDIKAELKPLSAMWRPWDPATATKGFAAYRNSSKELFADALSVLLRNPNLLKQRAPIFYKEFFDALDRKPEVKQAYYDLQQTSAQTRADLIAHRDAAADRMLTRVDKAAMDAELQKQKDLADSKDIWLNLKQQIVDTNSPVNMRVEALKKRGIDIPPEVDPKLLFKERAYLGGRIKGQLQKYVQPIADELRKLGIPWHTLGKLALYERIHVPDADRGDKANPLGLQPAAAEEQAHALMARLSPPQRQALRHAIDNLRTWTRTLVDEAHDVGLYSDTLYEQMDKNPAYAPFRVADYIHKQMSSRVYQQIGTLKDIQNPVDALILKNLAIIRAIQQQKMRLALFDMLHQHFPNDIEQADEKWDGRRKAPVESDKPHQKLVHYYEKGRLRGKYVDPYIERSVHNLSEGGNFGIVKLIRLMHTKWFRPAFTTMNMGFQTSNLARDFIRFWKNTPHLSVAKALQLYIKAHPMARVRAFGLPANATFTQRQAYKDLIEAENAMILSVTFNDMIAGRDVQDTQIADILSKHGIEGFESKPPPTGIKAVGVAIGDFIKKVGDYLETLPKGAAIYHHRGAGTISEIGPEERAMIRELAGSPDFLAGGTYKGLTNTLFLFSNAMVQGIRADYHAATDPKTRSGYWWKTAAVNLLPKLLLAGLLAAKFAPKGKDKDGDDEESNLGVIQRAARGISEYDKTNYNSVPLGIDRFSQSIYARLPQDDTGQLLGGLFWKAIHTPQGHNAALRTMEQVWEYAYGKIPSMTPVYGALTDTAKVLGGRNVYDEHRNKMLFTDQELSAGGAEMAKKFAKYEFNNLGGGVVTKLVPGEQRPRQETALQKFLGLPGISVIAGRYLKVSNYGDVEELQQAGKEVRSVEDKRGQDERKLINEALTKYEDLPKDKQTQDQRITMAREIAAKVYPREKQGDKAVEIQDKIDLGLVEGSNDFIVDALMSATSNDQKVAIILKGAETMSPKTYNKWIRVAVQNGAVSPLVAADVERAQIAARRPKVASQ
jgi:hypothetical protein